MLNFILNIVLIYYLIIFNLFSNDKKEIEITASSMEWNKEKSKAVATGGAKATQGNKILYANTIVVSFSEKTNTQTIIKLDASENVKFIRENQIATGDKATFHVDKEIIFIKGNVSLKRDDSIMLGDELTIDLNTSSSKLISKNNEKVRAKYNTESIE